MAEYADACVCFWDGKSKGTADMIRLSVLYKLQSRVINYWCIFFLPKARFRLLYKGGWFPSIVRLFGFSPRGSLFTDE